MLLCRTLHLRRAERLEIFDEFEEWTLINNHYGLIVGWQGQLPATGPSAGTPIGAVLFF